MKKTTIKISYDVFWELERIKANKELKSKDEVLRYILSKVHQNGLKKKKEVSVQ